MELRKWLVCIVAEQEVEVVELCTATVLEEEEEAGVGLLEEQEKWSPRMTYNYPRRKIVAVRQRQGDDEGNTPSQQYFYPWMRNCSHLYMYRYSRFFMSFFLHVTKADGVLAEGGQKTPKD